MTIDMVEILTSPLCVLSGKHEALEEEKQSSEEDTRRSTSEEGKELEFKYYQSNCVTMSVGQQQDI